MHHLTWAHGECALSKMQLGKKVAFMEINGEFHVISPGLDIRHGKIAKNLAIRHKAILAACNFLNSKGFLDMTAPFLATPHLTRACEHCLMHLKNHSSNLNFMLNKHPKGDK